MLVDHCSCMILGHAVQFNAHLSCPDSSSAHFTTATLHFIMQSAVALSAESVNSTAYGQSLRHYDSDAV